MAGFLCSQQLDVPMISWLPSSRNSGWKKDPMLPRPSSIGKCNSWLKFGNRLIWSHEEEEEKKKRGKHKHMNMVHVMSPDLTSSPGLGLVLGLGLDLLDATDDQYGGLHIQPNSLPATADAFASALRASLSSWKLQGKKGVWLKLLSEQADLVPIAIQEGFKYHHAEAEYVMLTHWIADEPCLLPASPSHLIGIAGFAMNERREVLVVKEKYPSSCSGVWKLPTGYVNKGEDLFCGAVREVKEETGVDTIFQQIIAFRHVHRVAFEKSDLLFACMLKPLSSQISIDNKELEAAQWMGVEELMRQPFYEEDQMTRKLLDICVEAEKDGGTSSSSGFISKQLISKLDGRLSSLYFQHT